MNSDMLLDSAREKVIAQSLRGVEDVNEAGNVSVNGCLVLRGKAIELRIRISKVSGTRSRCLARGPECILSAPERGQIWKQSFLNQ